MKIPASWIDRFYFSGYVFFTLGNGRITSIGGFWKVATVVATATGMLSITLAVFSAVSQKRSFAQSVMGVGNDGVELVYDAWNGKDFCDIDLLLDTFALELS